MKEGRTLPMIQPGSGDGVSRRAALQSLAAGFGARLAMPALAEAESHPVHRHLEHAAEAQKARAAAATKSSAFTPAFFDPHQYATTVLLSELIVPGSKASGTPEFLDKLMAVETPDTRRRFISALGAIDGASIAAHRKAFKELTPMEQTALLTEASTGQPSRQAVYWKKGDPIPLPDPPAAPATLRDHFDHVKGWVAGIYFASEPGLKELGWTGMMFHEKFVGCQHEGGHA